jgi:hypothetical protein
MMIIKAEKKVTALLALPVGKGKSGEENAGDG